MSVFSTAGLARLSARELCRLTHGTPVTLVAGTAHVFHRDRQRARPPAELGSELPDLVRHAPGGLSDECSLPCDDTARLDDEVTDWLGHDGLGRGARVDDY